MIPERMLEERAVQTHEGDFTITVVYSSLTHLYPGMGRYGIRVTTAEGRTLSEFFTNTYEYTPAMGLDAKTTVFHMADEWEEELSAKPFEMMEYFSNIHPRCLPAVEAVDVVVIQGSPRPDGNCGQIAKWIAEETVRFGGTVRVLYPDDMDIRPCIGCYQCYNSGFCTFADDMDEVFGQVQRCRVLAVCAPVYTCSVPGALKILIDRFLSYDAHRRVMGGGAAPHQAGLFFGVCGREGDENFAPLQEIAAGFFATAGIPLRGTAWADGMDRKQDVREVPDFADDVQVQVRRALEQTRASGSG
ncbi:flavodoxin family protein [Methanogenium organophilum]|uniref:Flavodoxin family protein n=1 Tax=Methanogenium organophilum TaxID=2199 RepID=A0A9X9T967_METOG|nr:flavodoxin family protein [Methanogenium organophilum]WAI02350.1 flavodoxin family protein [Methanogenium organophilum]